MSSAGALEKLAAHQASRSPPDLRDCLVTGARLSPSERDLLGVLVARRGRPVSRRDLWDTLYADREDGGPDPQVISMFLSRLRRRLRPSWRIDWLRYSGFAALLGPGDPPPDNLEVVLSHQEYAVFSLIRHRPGITGREICSALEIVHRGAAVRVYHLNRKLETRGIGIRVLGRAYEGYRVVVAAEWYRAYGRPAPTELPPAPERRTAA